MSGGSAYVYDADGDFSKKCNTAMVALTPLASIAEQQADADQAFWHSRLRGADGQADELILKELIERHVQYTGSMRARELLDQWAVARSKFVKVFPTEYKRALAEMHARRAVTLLKEALVA
jgi:glutamate synthase (NADPH) large chain